MKRGAQDFLEKPFTDAALIDILTALAQILPAQANAENERSDAVARLALLSPRERDVLRGLVAGMPNKTLARSLGISVRTVEMHRAHLMTRLNASSLAEVLRIAALAASTP